MRLFVFLTVMICGVVLAAHSQTPSPGTVHTSITVAADPSNSYARYLPSAYSPARRWPLLLVFDPFARGEVSVKLFHEAAEKYGLIVLCSNNTRKLQDPSAAIRALNFKTVV